MKINVNTAAGNLILGIYTSKTTGCPAGASICPGPQVCVSSSTAATTGDNIITPTGCGTFSVPSSTIWLGAVPSSNSLALNTTTSGCPGSVFWSPIIIGSSFALPSPATTVTNNQGGCWRISAVFNCLGVCGTTPVPLSTITYTGNTNGATLTAANLVTGSYGLNGVISTGTQLTGTTYVNTPVQAFTTSAIDPATGNSISGGTLSAKRTTTNTDNWSYTFNEQISPNASFGFWWQNTSNTMGNGDSCDIGEIGGGNILTWHLVGAGGTVTLGIEQSGGATTNNGSVPYTQGTPYFLTTQNNSGGTHHGEVFNTSGSQVGSTINITADHAGNPADIRLMDDGSCSATAGIMDYGPIKVDPYGTAFPITGQLFFPDSIKTLGPVLAGKVARGEIKRAEMVSSSGGPWKKAGWWSYALGRYISE
jgi:hypothetical protein